VSDTPENIGLDNKSQAERDQIDLNHEISGADTGRNSRFISAGSNSVHAQNQKKKKEERRYLTMLDMLLAEDARYAALYHRVNDFLNRVEDAAEKALKETNALLAQAELDHKKLLDNAAESPDGKKVFRSSKDGSIYTQDGRKLSAKEASKIKIPDGAPSREEFKKSKWRIYALRGQKEEIKTYQREFINPAKKRMKSGDNPFSPDDLKDFKERANKKMPDAIGVKLGVPTISADIGSTKSLSVAHSQIDNTKIQTPDMTNSFNLARTDLPNIPTSSNKDVSLVKTMT